MNDNELYHPFLTGEHIYLRGLEETDLQGNYYQWFNNQSTDTYTHHALYPNSPEKMKAFYEKALCHENMFVLAIIHKEDNCHIGNISLQQIEWINRRAELAIILGERNYFGKGYATEAGRLIIDYGFDRFNLNSIWLGVHAENKRAITVYKKLGFIEEGLIRERFIRNQTCSDQILMSILRKEWQKK
ncbi:MAG: GNAT family N-acetyltransferase [Proteobacteria bacterium]|nr:GNAT family N-acetyltransferase [Pseudomonadota bacterium]